MGNMRYAVAKYIPDLFRQEPRNVGVFVVDGRTATMRLMGQDDDGSLDLRRARMLQEDGSIYAEWFAFWRRILTQYNGKDFRSRPSPEEFIASLVEESGDMFVVWDGGEYIPDSDDESINEATRVLYRDLVVTKTDTSEDQPDEKGERPGSLASSVRSTFHKLGLLATKRDLDDPFARHLIRQDFPVLGTLDVPHRPKYSQVNGKLTVIEQVDFGAYGEEKVTHHALGTAYMLGNIREANALALLELIVIVHWSLDRNGYAQEVGRSALASVDGTQLVNWDNSWERERFLKQRAAAAHVPFN